MIPQLRISKDTWDAFIETLARARIRNMPVPTALIQQLSRYYMETLVCEGNMSLEAAAQAVRGQIQVAYPTAVESAASFEQALVSLFPEPLC